LTRTTKNEYHLRWTTYRRETGADMCINIHVSVPLDQREAKQDIVEAILHGRGHGIFATYSCPRFYSFSRSIVIVTFVPRAIEPVGPSLTRRER
jgi:hypothetical protein